MDLRTNPEEADTEQVVYAASLEAKAVTVITYNTPVAALLYTQELDLFSSNAKN